MMLSIGSLWRSRDGNISVMFALALPVLIGIVALVGEFGNALITRTQNQRIADMSAYAGAIAYNSTASSTRMTDAAAAVAGLNGIPTTEVTTTLVTSPKTASLQAVSVKIGQTRELLLAPVLKAKSDLPINTNAVVEIPGSTPGCIIALSGSESGVTLSGGTSLSAPACAISSNNTVTVPCGTKITTPAVNYNSAAAPTMGCAGGIVAPSGKTLSIKKVLTTDPLASYAGVSTATSRFTTVTAMTAPAAPTAPTVTVATGTDISFPWWNDTSYFPGKLPTGCTAGYGSNWTITCVAGGTYNFGAVTFQNASGFALSGTSATTTTFNFKGDFNVSNGTITMPAANYNFATNLLIPSGGIATFGAGTFNIAGNLTLSSGAITFGASTMKVGKAITISSGTATFGAGTYSAVNGLTTGGGTTTTFGAGTFNFGTSTAACDSGATYSICHKGTTLTMGGPSTFNLTAGIFNNGGSTMSLGSGTANVYKVGGSSAGNALYMGGGAKTTFADASGNGLFQLVGNLNVTSGGGSCLTLPAATQHDIKGYFSTAGGTVLGAGVYTVNGYIALGANGGGDVTCNGNTVGISGTNVTLVTNGATTPSSGTCSGKSFCVAAGYGNVKLEAPMATDAATSKLLVVGPTGSITAGATFAEGATTSLSGAFYFPKGPISLSGGASIGNGAGQCLQLVGSNISLSGGTTAASACITGSSAGTSIVLVQ